jgi:hypothetical protein
MATRLRVKAGSVEVEYEGEAVFDEGSLRHLLSHVRTLLQPIAEDEESDSEQGVQTGNGSKPGGVHLHTSEIAARLSVKTGRELTMAAAAHLAIVSEKASFTRRELLADMKSAPRYYGKSMASNLTQALRSLVRSGQLERRRDNSFSLPDVERKALEWKLSNGAD